MHILSFEIHNFRCFRDTGRQSVGPMNLLVGRNNTGKSAILRALHGFQTGNSLTLDDIRRKEESLIVSIDLADMTSAVGFGVVQPKPRGLLRYELSRQGPASVNRTLKRPSENAQSVGELHGSEPHVFFYPLFGRRPSSYGETINADHSNRTHPEWENLAARLDKQLNRINPMGPELLEAMKATIGVEIGAISSESGKLPGTHFTSDETALITRMGAGVVNAVTILSCVVGAHNRVFLIEEPENDLHPTALRSLLGYIEKASVDNQFFISTHSHLVVRSLGSLPNSQVLQISSASEDKIPDSQIILVQPSLEARHDLLRDLGYELGDYDLFEGWLFLEESSAERLIRQYFIKWYCPWLVGRLRTIAANGTGDLTTSFTTYHKLFLFTHLQVIYKKRAWVIADGDQSGRDVTDKLRATYRDHEPSRFMNWSKTDFERYYPAEFAAEASVALSEVNKAEKRRLKKLLLEKLIQWISVDEEEARRAFDTSAEEVIGCLKGIESALRELVSVST